MDDNAPKENPPADFNKLDLTQLQGFSFGTQWTQDKSSPSERRERESGSDRPRRDDRREGGGGPGGAPSSRDRRGFRRPAGPGGPGEGAAPAAGAPAGAPERRDYAGPGGPRRDGPGGEYRGGPRRDGAGGGGDYRGGPRQGGRGDYPERQAYGPYDSPFFNVTFYPEDTSFNTLVQTIRKSCRTIELFEIARTVVAKLDRFVVVVARKPSESAAPAAGAVAQPAKAAFYISVPDALPFESDEAAVAHVMANHLDKFFDKAEVEVDPPKGNYQVINKCGITGELLGPPNYHRYAQIVQQHHAAKVARMSLEAFKSRIETVRDEEAVKQWLEKMKKTTRYTWKQTPKAAPAAAAAAATVKEDAALATDGAPAPAEAAPAETVAEAAPVAVVPTFDSLEDARLYLLTQVRDKVVRTSENARFHGKIAESLPPGEIRRAIEGALERQRKFPLDTANALRGRLRREHFTIFKKGSKGVSYVCAVKRKFRVPGQTFSDSIGALISFIEASPMVRASELPTKFLGIALPAPVKAPEAAPAPAAPAADAPVGETTAPAAEAPVPAPAPVEPTLTIDERAKLSRLQGDLVWLVREGYVTEFIDGRLFAPPAVVEARKKEIETEEHDPENFPEAPASESAPAPAPAAEEAPAPVAEEAPAPVAAVEAAPEAAPAPVVEETKPTEPTA